MKKILLILVALAAVFVIAFNVSDTIWYETHTMFVRIFAKEDGTYCLTPYTCIGVIHEYGDLYKKNADYIEKYGSQAPGRPGKLYKYNPDMKCYVRWMHY